MAARQQPEFPFIDPQYVWTLRRGGCRDEDLQAMDEQYQKRYMAELERYTFSPKICVVLIGGTGSGKSTAGNIILGQEEGLFRTGSGVDVCTRTVQYGESVTDRTVVGVVDTPGFIGDGMTAKIMSCELLKIIDIFPEGIDIFLFVFNLARPEVSDAQLYALKQIKEEFGEELLGHCAVLLTNGKTLIKRDSSLDKYLEEIEDTNLGQLLLEIFSGRVMAVEGFCLKGELELQTRKVRSFLRSITDGLNRRPYHDHKYKELAQNLKFTFQPTPSLRSYTKAIKRVVPRILHPITQTDLVFSDRLVSEALALLQKQYILHRLDPRVERSLEDDLACLIQGKIERLQRLMSLDLSHIALFKIANLLNSAMLPSKFERGKPNTQIQRYHNNEHVKVPNMSHPSITGTNQYSSGAVQSYTGYNNYQASHVNRPLHHGNWNQSPSNPPNSMPSAGSPAVSRPSPDNPTALRRSRRWTLRKRNPSKQNPEPQRESCALM